jgi:carbamoyltransferase
MNVLGVADGHDAAAALIRDGRIIAAAEEERFIRIKHASGFFPKKSIAFCLKKAELNPSDVEYVGYYMNPSEVIPGALDMLRAHGRKNNMLGWASYMAYFMPRRAYKVKSELARLGVRPKKIFYINHHLCHAASAYRVSGFKDAMIMTLDGAGEREASFFGAGENGEIRKLRNTNIPNSLGMLYAGFTSYLGFEPNDAEWKVMGLAPYGKPTYDLSRIVRLRGRTFAVDSRYIPTFQDFSGYYTKRVVDEFGPARTPESPLEERHKNIAASLQKSVEDVAIKLVEQLHDDTSYDKLCLAGGVALNCKMNGLILRSPFVKDIFIQPAAGDAGTALGAALEVSDMLGERPKDVFEHCYYGAGYTDEETESAVKVTKLKYEEHKDIAKVAAELVAEGKIIAWYQGPFEWGPRALGNRSILADPRDKAMKDKVNAVIKFREDWRPFAPSMLAEDADKYLEDAYPSPFMILSFQVKDGKLGEIPAVTHVDNSTRPQTVEKRINPKYHAVINEFKKLTGVSVVMNTSFNIRGQPIINTPREALETFGSTGLDALVIGNFLLQK